MKYLKEHSKGIINILIGILFTIIFGWSIQKLTLVYIIYLLLEIK
jgi:hypothetical protein